MKKISFKKILACMVMASFCIGTDAENVAEGPECAPGATRIGRNAMEESEERTVVIDEKKPIEEAVVTGTRNETDIRHLPFTVSVVGRSQIEQSHEVSLLPILSEQVPGLFVTQRAMMGYGVSEGAAGGISMRGLSGGSGRMMVLIDGHPQYMGLMGHPISDAYQSFLAERVEVLRGPASMLYGSNAMGGVINIVTRRMQDDGVRTNAHVARTIPWRRK